MTTVSAGSVAEVYCPFDGSVTVVPGTAGRAVVRGLSVRNVPMFAQAQISESTSFAVTAGGRLFVEAVGADAEYSGGVTLTAPGGSILTFSEVVEEVLANPSATTTVLTGAGLYSHYRCTTAAGNITVYDNTAASGKVLVPTTALALGSFPIFGSGNPNRLAVSTGVTVVLSGAAVVYVGAGEG